MTSSTIFLNQIKKNQFLEPTCNKMAKKALSTLTFDQWADYFRTNIRSVELGNLKKIIKEHKELETHNFCICLIDLSTFNYVYISENIKNLTGYSSDDFMKEGIKKLESISPDSQAVYSSTKKAFQKILTLPLKDRVNVRIQFSYRIYKPNGEMRWILRQSRFLKLDSKGRPAMDCACLMDITPFKNDDTIACRINWEGGSEIFYPDSPSGTIVFTERELEVAKLIQQGLISKEIAPSLFISQETVKSHRKNIFKKTSSKNIVEALKKMRKLGVIE